MGDGPAAVSAARRVVTGHDAGGRSVVLEDGPTPRTHAVPGAVFHELWNTTASPVPLDPEEPREPTDRPVVTPPGPNGTIVRIVDFEPRSRSPMHRTETVDYGIVLSGELTLVLDDGSETPLRRGDVVVQRGTAHAWVNPSAESAQMVFVLVDGRFSDELRALLPVEPELFDHTLDP
jgi:quercetin dioxygenase-like cupin family protein